MEDLKASMKALGQARRRKKELKSLLEILYEEYKLVKTEIKLHEKRIEKSMSAHEYSAFLDTTEIDTSPELPILPDQRSIDKKTD